jgi:hypothetical protein
MVAVQLLGDVGALLTGGAVVMLLAGATVVLTVRRRPRGWVVGAAMLAGIALFQLPWALFVASATRAAGGDAGAWAWTVLGLALAALGATAWLLSSLPRGRLALDRDRVTTLAGALTLLAGVAATGLGVGTAVAGRAPTLALGLVVTAWVLLRTLRAAEAGRHLADVVVATSLFAGLVWWVSVGTLQGAASSPGLLVVAVVVFLALLTRAGKAVDATPADAQPKRPEM